MKLNKQLGSAINFMNLLNATSYCLVYCRCVLFWTNKFVACRSEVRNKMGRKWLKFLVFTLL
jgi:hypothetical protein